jgi:hypothetical protein
MIASAASLAKVVEERISINDCLSVDGKFWKFNSSRLKQKSLMKG